MPTWSSRTSNPHRGARLPLRIARWSATHPWRAIGGWLALVAAAAVLAIVVPTQQTTDRDYRVGESGRAAAMLTDGGLTDQQVESVLVTARHRGAPTADEVDEVRRQIASRTHDLPGVTGVGAPRWNTERTAALIDVRLGAAVDDVSSVQRQTARVAAAHPDLSVREAGDLSLDAAINHRVAEDLHSAEGISLPITLVLMLLAFGALIAAGVPVLLAITSVAATIGIATPLSHLIHAEPTVTSMIVLIGMAVGIDYSLFYLKREREERAKGGGTLDAVEIAAATSGHAILVSGVAVIACLTGLLIVQLATFDSLAAGAIIVVATSVVGSVTVLPALLTKLGRWVDRPRLPLWGRLTDRLGTGGISRRVLAPVVRRPVAALLLTAGALAALAVPALGMKTVTGNLDTLPDSIAEVRTLHAVTAAFPSQGSTADVVVSAPASHHAAVVAGLRALADRAGETRWFGHVGADALRSSADRRTVQLTLPIPFDWSDDRAATAVGQLRDHLVPGALDGLPVEQAVGGDVAESLDYDGRLHERMPLVIGFVLLLTVVTMGVTFRSLRVAVVSSALNLLSVGVAFGVLTLVFQHGWSADALGVATPGAVIAWVPLFVMVVLVGLSMDYNVFVLARIREHAVTGLPVREAVSRGVADTAGVITSAAAVMVSVFALFATLSLLEMKMLGVALATSILIDATLIRLVLLPAALILLGERVWRPARAVEPAPDNGVAPRPALIG